MATCRWKELCYVRRAKAFFACASLQNCFHYPCILGRCFHCLCTPKRCFHSSCTPIQPHFPLPPLSLILIISFSAKVNLPSNYSALNISVLASSSGGKTPERTLLLTPLQMSGAVPGECRCTARVRLIRELGTQGKACVAWLRASRKYRKKEVF